MSTGSSYQKDKDAEDYLREAFQAPDEILAAPLREAAQVAATLEAAGQIRALRLGIPGQLDELNNRVDRLTRSLENITRSLDNVASELRLQLLRAPRADQVGGQVFDP